MNQWVTVPLEQRFWSKVAVGEPDECWEWQAARMPRGYGVIGGPVRYAHRAVWVLTHGEVPAGMHVLHRCDNPPCVNPAHLFLGTHAKNVADMDAKGRRKGPKGETHPAAKLTAEQVRAIRRECAEVSQRVVAERYGVDPSTVSRIVHGKQWRSV